MKLLFVLFLAVASAHPHLGAKEPLIVGGQAAAPEQFKYQVALNHGNLGEFGTFTCGGSIYNEWTIITACHCVYGRDTDDFTIVAGNIDRQSVDATRIKVEKVVMHPAYTGGGVRTDNDVALLYLSTPLTMDENIAPIALSEQIVPAGTSCIVSGWGTLTEGGSLANTLMYVGVDIVSDQQCQVDYPSFLIVPEDMICAGEEGKDSCQGDSGGPFACNNQLAGIVSWGSGCAEAGFPGIYTEVAQYANWIETNAKITA